MVPLDFAYILMDCSMLVIRWTCSNKSYKHSIRGGHYKNNKAESKQYCESNFHHSEPIHRPKILQLIGGPMLAKLIEINEASSQAQYLTQLTELCIKNSQEFVDQLNQELVQNLLTQNVLNKINFLLWLELAMNLLSIQQCFDYASADTPPTTPALKLLDAIALLDAQAKYEKINTLLTKYSTIELSLVMHSILARHCVVGVPEKRLPRLLPIFIKLSSFIVEKYFQLKNEPSKGDEDRMEDDKVILKCCEKWLTKNIEIFFSKIPPINKPFYKSLVLLAVSDIIGALLETDRQNLLDKQLTSYLLDNVLLAYCRKNYTHNQICNLFLKGLESKGFNNPMKKIQIPEIYSEESLTKIGLSPQAYVYIMLRFMKSGLMDIASNESLLRILIPAVSQIMIRPYEIKIQAIYLLEKLVERMKPIKMSTCFEYGYPIQLFFFYLYQCENEKYNKIRDIFLIENDQEFVNSLLVLQDIFIENLQRDKQKYVLQMIEKYQLYNERVFILVRKIRFKEEKVKRQLQLLEMMGKLKGNYEKETIQVLKTWKKQVGERMDSSVKTKIQDLGL